MKKILLALMVVAMLSSCVTNREALNASGLNKQRIQLVRLGQTMSDVLKSMAHDPEIRSVRRTADAEIEEWSYVTNYDSDIVTKITFTDKRVTAIGTESWDGTWVKDTLRPEDVLVPNDELAPRASAIAGMVETVKPGDPVRKVEEAAGPPHANDRTYAPTGAYRDGRLIYHTPNETVIVYVRDGVVDRVETSERH